MFLKRINVIPLQKTIVKRASHTVNGNGKKKTIPQRKY